MSLRLSGIRHAYGPREVLRGIDLETGPGEILCLLGPSGDGKTTLLRLVAGLEPLQAGRIELNGTVLAEPGRELPPAVLERPAGQGAVRDREDQPVAAGSGPRAHGL